MPARRPDCLWPCRDLPQAPPAEAPAAARTSFVTTGDALADRLAPSLVLVNYSMPFSVAGVTERNYHGRPRGGRCSRSRGRGSQHGACRRGDVRLTFAGSVEVPAGSNTCTRCTTSRSSRSIRSCSTGRRSVPRPWIPRPRAWRVGSRRRHEWRFARAFDCTTVASVDDVSFRFHARCSSGSELEVARLVNGPRTSTE